MKLLSWISICLLMMFTSSACASAWLGHGPDAPKSPALKAKETIGVWQSLEITAKPIGVSGRKDQISFTIGKLKWRGGIVLTSRDKNFGGFSGLRLSADGQTLQSVSDRARWLKADVVYDQEGAITDLQNAEMATMMRHNGEELQGTAGDAEGLELLPGGKAIVSFERYHRLDLYQPDEAGKYIYEQRILHNRLVKGLSGNSSLEAVARLQDGRVLTFAEGAIGKTEDFDDETSLLQGNERPGWISGEGNWIKGGDDWQTLAYQTAPDFSITDIAQDDLTEEVFVLERAFSRSKGVRARITRVPVSALQAGAVIEGEELAILNMVQGIDNMEGLDLRRLPNGRLMLYMISDDNFNIGQRTVILSWEVLSD